MATVTQSTPTEAQSTNPHQVGTVITLIAIPIVFLGALWGAGHHPEHASWSVFAFAATVVIHLVKRIQRATWNLRSGK